MITMTTVWLLLLVLTTAQIVVSQPTTDDETGSDEELLQLRQQNQQLQQLRQELQQQRQLVQQHQAVLYRVGKYPLETNMHEIPTLDLMLKPVSLIHVVQWEIIAPVYLVYIIVLEHAQHA